MSLRAHKVVITTRRDSDGFRFGTRVTLDGRELLVSADTPAAMTVGRDDVMLLTLTLFADVELRVVEDKPSPGSGRRLWARLRRR